MINRKTALSQTSLPRQEFLTYEIVYKKYSTNVYNEVTCGNKHRHRLLKCYHQKIVSILNFQAQLRFHGLF